MNQKKNLDNLKSIQSIYAQSVNINATKHVNILYSIIYNVLINAIILQDTPKMKNVNAHQAFMYAWKNVNIQLIIILKDVKKTTIVIWV
jgi:hypothetical protein